MKTLEQALLNRILYIGKFIPENSPNDTRPKFVLLGTPQELMNEVSPSNKSEHEIICWIAEYAYAKANPESEMGEPPSMVYGQVARDFQKFLSSPTTT